jgi:hypothetical protein
MAVTIGMAPVTRLVSGKVKESVMSLANVHETAAFKRSLGKAATPEARDAANVKARAQTDIPLRGSITFDYVKAHPKVTYETITEAE